MPTLEKSQPVDGYGESTISFGEAIGAANTDFGTKATGLDSRGIISTSSSLTTYVNGSNETVYVCYIVTLLTTYDI